VRSVIDRPARRHRLYVEVTDLEATPERVVRLGGTVDRTRISLGGDDRWFAVLRDAAGISIGVWTANPPPNNLATTGGIEATPRSEAGYRTTRVGTGYGVTRLRG
jgi:hypothetical protein